MLDLFARSNANFFQTLVANSKRKSSKPETFSRISQLRRSGYIQCRPRSVDPFDKAAAVVGGWLRRGSLDGGSLDGGSLDGGSLDGGSLDGGSLDGGSLDGGSLEDLEVWADTRSVISDARADAGSFSADCVSRQKLLGLRGKQRSMRTKIQHGIIETRILVIKSLFI
jgi:hypothetical protein